MNLKNGTLLQEDAQIAHKEYEEREKDIQTERQKTRATEAAKHIIDKLGYEPTQQNGERFRFGDIWLEVGRVDRTFDRRCIRVLGKCPTCEKENVLSKECHDLIDIGSILNDFVSRDWHYRFECTSTQKETQELSQGDKLVELIREIMAQ